MRKYKTSSKTNNAQFDNIIDGLGLIIDHLLVQVGLSIDRLLGRVGPNTALLATAMRTRPYTLEMYLSDACRSPGPTLANLDPTTC